MIGIIGAPGTGKTSLAHRLSQSLAAEGQQAAVVPDLLGEFRKRERRLPTHEDLLPLVIEQTQRIDSATATHDIVIGDTTALMVAVHAELVFRDASLYPKALAAQRSVDLALLTALNPASPIDGGDYCARVDERLRGELQRAGFTYSVAAGEEDDRFATALKAVRHALRRPEPLQERTRWQWMCERCGDVDCERHLLARG